MRLGEHQVAVIGVYMEKGVDYRARSEDVVAKKQVLSSQFQTDQCMKTGLEYEKSVFFDEFADQPEVIKAAK